jgi:hypothetical protein
VSPMRYGLRVYIPEDGILHSHRRENLKSHIIYHRQKRLYVIYFAAVAKTVVSTSDER